MDTDQLEAIIAAAVEQYAAPSPANRPALAEAAAGAIFALPWALDEQDRHEEAGNWPSSSSLNVRAHRRQ